MGPSEWIAFAAVMATAIAGMGSIVWLLATMNAALKGVVTKVDETHETLTQHAKECDASRLELFHHRDEHARRLEQLEM